MIRIAVTAALLFAALSMSAVALGVPGKGSAKGMVEAQSIGGFPLAFRINAKSQPRDEAAKGTFSEILDRSGSDLGILEFRGDVVCLEVDGNHAAAKGVVDESTHPLVPVGSQMEIHIEDNGDLADRWSTGFWSGPQDGCPDPAEEVFGPTAESGNLVVSGG